MLQGKTWVTASSKVSKICAIFSTSGSCASGERRENGKVQMGVSKMKTFPLFLALGKLFVSENFYDTKCIRISPIPYFS